MTIMTTTTLVPAHRVAEVSDGSGSRAECSCGWASDWHPTPEAADIAGGEHTEAFGPPDGLDRAMTELLDLQDDLAAAVVWLAENWSADLPAPLVYAATHYGEGLGPVGQAGARLLVPCRDDAQLAHAAVCLGEPVMEDPAYGRPGTRRYRRATRVLGRVHIEASAPLGEAAP